MAGTLPRRYRQHGTLATLRRLRVRREVPGMCGPYALEGLLRFYHRPVPVARLAALARTSAQGTAPESLARAARRLALRVRVRQWAELSDLAACLKRGHPPMVLWFSRDDGHYSVVVGLTARTVILADPERGGRRHLPREVFRRVWFDFAKSGPERGARLYARWLMECWPPGG